MSNRSQEVGHRRYRRFPISLPIVARAESLGETEALGTGRNIGGGGVMAEFSTRFPPGSVVDLTLQARYGSLTMRSQVAWAGPPGPHVAHGIAFCDPCGDEVARGLALHDRV